MGGGNPISVAANFRLVFDTRSAARTATKYDAAMSNIVAKGATRMAQADEEAKKRHATTVRSLMEDNKIAQETFEKNSKKLVSSIIADQRRAHFGRHKQQMEQAKDLKSYKVAEGRYKAALTGMSVANKKYAAEMKRLGIASVTGFRGAEFGAMGPQRRRQAILGMQRMIKLGKFRNEDLKAANRILNTMYQIDSGILQLEKAKGFEIGKNKRKIREAGFELDRSLKKSAIGFKQLKQQALELNMALSQMANHIKMGVTQALMTSAIVMVSFGFKLQQIISQFQDFEQELRNANSIWQTTNDTLYEASNTILEFGTIYGIELQNATEGLYQMASAGLTAAESQQMLTSTLRLSMAVQGDHEQLAKLTIQVLKGFGLEMSDAARETDRMAYAINKSLLQWEDLTSGIKFAMPFFVSMNQETVQLYGALEVLADRALEAGISGRGLRQALAQFAKHAEDNTAAFARMGIETQNANGEFLQLTEIASNFAEAFGDAYTDAEMMTQLLEDFNVRGATAFVHLVQNAEEFNYRVEDLVNATGAAKDMADRQNESIRNQITIMKNAFTASMFMADSYYEQFGAMNELDLLMKTLVLDFREFMFIQTETGLVLSENGEIIKNLVLQGLVALVRIMRSAYKAFEAMNVSGDTFGKMLHLSTIPLKLVLDLITMLGEGGMEAVIMYKMMNSLIPINSLMMFANQSMMVGQIAGQQAVTSSLMLMAGANVIAQGAMFAGILMMNKQGEEAQKYGKILVGAAGAVYGLNIALAILGTPTSKNLAGFAIAAVAGAGMAVQFAGMMQDLMQPPEDFTYEPVDFGGMDTSFYDNFDPSQVPIDPSLTTTMDMGGRFIPTYDTGGYSSEHGLAILQKGETVSSKTSNMLGGTGINIIIEGDVYDGDNFAEKVHEVLGPTLERQQRQIMVNSTSNRRRRGLF